MWAPETPWEGIGRLRGLAAARPSTASSFGSRLPWHPILYRELFTDDHATAAAVGLPWSCYLLIVIGRPS
jgi:hypothetical protein